MQQLLVWIVCDIKLKLQLLENIFHVHVHAVIYADSCVQVCMCVSNVITPLCVCVYVYVSLLECHIPHLQYVVHMHGCCLQYKKPFPSQLDNKHRMAWHNSKIIYLAPLLFSSMVFVESEETICCPVIMGGQGGGD